MFTMQIGTPWFDGTEGVTQCPVLPGDTFIYQFVVDRVSSKEEKKTTNKSYIFCNSIHLIIIINHNIIKNCFMFI